MTGIETARDTAAVIGQSKPILVPSRSIDVSRISPAPRDPRPRAPTRPRRVRPRSGRCARRPRNARRRRRCLASIATIDRLAAVAPASVVMSAGFDERRGVQADLVGAGLDGRRRVGFRPDAAADGERDEQLARDGANRVGQRAALLERRGDVEDDELVDAFAVVAPRQLGRIAGRCAGLRSSRP